jgi:RNA polymerase sigma-70 factor, ECF subfamily
MAGGQIPQLQVERDETEDLVRRSVLALPQQYRDAMTVFYFREMDLAETAAILGVSEGTVKSWLHRGRELLRRKFDKSEAVGGVVKEVRI